MTADGPTDSTAALRLTDSPWFWTALFSATALGLLLVIWPQYAKRQRRLEMQYLARREVDRRQAAGDHEARPPGEEGASPPPAAGELLISLGPLATLFAALLAGSSAMLWRSSRSAPSRSGAPPPRGAP